MDEPLYREPLPAGCPDSQALEHDGFVGYRLVATWPPTAEDFSSFRLLFPERKVKSECLARAVSVFSDRTSCERVLKLPTQKGKTVAKLTLGKNAGRLAQTFADQFHYSWWIYKAFDPIPCCELCEPTA